MLLDDHPDLPEVEHGHTRAGRPIDRSFVNFGRSIVEAGTLPPLESEEGSQSVHWIAYARSRFLVEPTKTTSYTFMQFAEKGASAFLRDVALQSWTAVYNRVDTSGKVGEFQSILDALMNKHFAFRTVTKRLSDPPWFTKWLKKK